MGAFMKALVVVGIILTFVSLAVVICAAILNVVDMNYNYNSKIHSHMENAYYSADPDTMKSEIILARDGMKNAGLTPDMYDAFWSWEKTPDRKMEWQYKHIDSILVRIEEFRKWEASQNATGSQQMKDVYTEKLDNVRYFIKDDDGWSDWIAEGAFRLNNYFWLIVMSWLGVVGFVFGSLITGVGMMFGGLTLTVRVNR